MKKIEFLFSDFCNIYGEFYNVEYLKRCSSDIEVIYSEHKDVPTFISEDVDMIYMGCMTEDKQEIAIDVMKEYQSSIVDKMNKSTIFLITGNGLEMFGKYIKSGDRTIDALGLFDFHSERYMDRPRYNGQFIGDFGDMKLIGHKSQYSFSYGNFEDSFIELERGRGMNPESNLEGIHKNNFFGTYSLGPFLILNPNFTKYLLRLMGLSDSLIFEDEIMEAYRYRLEELYKTI